MNNRDEIRTLLTQFTPLEQAFKRYFEENSHTVSERESRRLLKSYGGIPGNLIEEFLLSPTYGAFWAEAELPIISQFSDAQWFLDNEDIIVRKHARYSPVSFHTHSFIEVAYVFQGSCLQTFRYPGGQSEILEQKEGSLCILPPNLEHSVSIMDNSVLINILIRTSIMKNTLANLVIGNNALFDFFLYTLYENTKPNYLLFHTKDNDSIQDILLDMTAESCQDTPYSQKVLLLMLGLFFTYLQRDHSDDVVFSQITSAGISYIPQVLNYIEQNYANISVKSIARHFSVSTSYLGRIFRDNTQTTIMDTLQNMRIQKACGLLSSTTLSVQDIAERVGYSDVTYFIRMFKKQIQTTPLQYRKSKHIL